VELRGFERGRGTTNRMYRCKRKPRARALVAWMRPANPSNISLFTCESTQRSTPWRWSRSVCARRLMGASGLRIALWNQRLKNPKAESQSGCRSSS
jgi:hypothetical protein